MNFDYQLLLNEAMLGIVKKILMQIQDKGIYNNQCLYISFRTDMPEVILSKNIKRRYPKEITIVLQYQFKNLIVSSDKFLVNISFGGLPETIEVPFSALTGFVDPEANFSLQFNSAEFTKNIVDMESNIDSKIEKIMPQKANTAKKQPQQSEEGEIIAIDAFRKRKQEKK